MNKLVIASNNPGKLREFAGLREAECVFAVDVDVWHVIFPQGRPLRRSPGGKVASRLTSS